MKVPIVLFVFNRPDKTKCILEAIRNQTTHPEKLTVFADEARNSTDRLNVMSVRNLINSIDWIDVELFERGHNYGCASNIIHGLTQVFQYHDKAAVLEDDTLPAFHWYETMCLLLDHFATDSTVFSVGGYPSIKADALPDYPYDVILSPRFSCWGWGTWANRWHNISEDLLDFKNPFGSTNDIPLYAGSDMRDSAKLIEKRPGFYWDYPIGLICLHRRFLNALTRYYLVQNIGTDSGTHGRHMSQELLRFMEENNRIVEKLPESLPPVSLVDSVCQAVQQYVNKTNSTKTGQKSLYWNRITVRSIVKGAFNKLLKPLGIEIRRTEQKEKKVNLPEVDGSRLGEDILALGYLNAYGIKNKVCIDIGASDGVTESNTYLLFKKGYEGFAAECDSKKFSYLASAYANFKQVNLAKCKVTPDNVVSLLNGFSVPKQFAFLNLDIDSYDYFVLDAILGSFRPHLVCAEINEKIPPPLKFTVIYDSKHTWHGDHFYGCSISMMYTLCIKHDYSLINLQYNNVFLVPTEITRSGESLSPEEAYSRGYLERPDRREKFPWNSNMEELLFIPPEEALIFIDKLFLKYAGKYKCSL